MELNIAEATITNVTQQKRFFADDGFVIFFEMDGESYRLHTQKKDDGLVHPDRVYHMDENFDCPLCKGTFSPCVLTSYCYALFERLIEYPTVRLEWLFIPHWEESIKCE